MNNYRKPDAPGRRVDAAHPGHKILPFRAQRALAAFGIALLLILFSIAVIWNHIDAIDTFSPLYRTLAKAGLVMVEVTAVVFLCWELWARDKALSLACYVAEFILVIVMLVHAGAVLQLDASGAQQKQTLSAVADAQAKVAAARETARIQAAGQQAAELNRMGQRQTARRIVQSAGQGSDSNADNALLGQVVTQTQPTTFLPSAYLRGGMYYWPPLIAFVLFMCVLLISKAAVPYEDANRNGIPDHLEPWAFQQPTGGPVPATAQEKKIGFPTNPNFQFNAPQRPAEVSDPKAQPPRQA